MQCPNGVQVLNIKEHHLNLKPSQRSVEIVIRDWGQEGVRRPRSFVYGDDYYEKNTRCFMFKIAVSKWKKYPSRLSIYLSTYLIYLSNLTIYLVYLSVYISHSFLYPNIYLYRVSIYFFISSICLYIYCIYHLPHCLNNYFAFLSVCLYGRLSISSVYLSIYLLIHPLLCLSVWCRELYYFFLEISVL